MAKLKISKLGDDILRCKSRDVDAITPRTLKLLDDMAETMRAADGCGLAAPQVGVLRKIVVIETPESGLIELINPVITETSGEQEEVEGCLSIPGKSGITKRPMNVTVEALDRYGNKRIYHGNDLLARAVCHEIDHLYGRLYIDIAKDIEDN